MKKFAAFLLICALFGLPFFAGAFSAQSTTSSLRFDTQISARAQETILDVSALEQAPNEQSKEFVVSANSAPVFAEANFSATRIATLSHRDTIFVLTDAGSPIEEFWNRYKFLKINLQENKIQSQEFEFGYIFADLVTRKQEEVVAMPNFNAQTNKECHVFLKRNTAFEETDTLLSRGQKIFLYEGFDSKKDYTAISYVVADKIFYGYLKTEDISPNGINPVLITCIILIAALLSIIFAWLFMRRKHVSLKTKAPGKYDLNKK